MTRNGFRVVRRIIFHFSSEARRQHGPQKIETTLDRRKAHGRIRFSWRYGDWSLCDSLNRLKLDLVTELLEPLG